MMIRQINRYGPNDLYIGYDALQSLIDREAGAGHLQFAERMFPGLKIQDARAVRQTLSAGSRGGHGLHIAFRSPEDAAAAYQQMTDLQKRLGGGKQ